LASVFKLRGVPYEIGRKEPYRESDCRDRKHSIEW